MAKRKRHDLFALPLACVPVFALVGLGGCERGNPDWTGPTAATLGEQKVLSNKEYLAQDSYERANIEYGERLSQQCQKCHTLEQGAAHNKGPNLFGFVGQVAGSQSDFPYSDALRNSEFVWSPRALDAWMAAPKSFLPGNEMKFKGLPDSGARAALIAYLLSVTDKSASPD